MTIVIPQGESLIFYDNPVVVDLNLYKDYIYQVFEIHNGGEWFKLYNPETPEFSDFHTMTASLSYQFFAYTEFTITV